MLLLALLAPLALQAPADSNPSNALVLNNGVDILYWLSDPSGGAPTGTFPPDIGADLIWKVVPRELLRHPQGTMELSGLSFFLTNLGTGHSPVFWDLWIARGKASSYPLVEPDFADPNGIFLSLGPSGLPTICEIFPECCDASGCVTCTCEGPPPYAGCSPVWTIELTLGTGPGSGITVRADGSEDLTVTAFSPGGMSYLGSACTADYSTMYAVSDDEQLFDWTGGYASGYGGWQVSGSGLLPESVEVALALQVGFVEPIVSPYLAGDLTYGYLPGLAGLRPLASGGAAALGVHSRAIQAAAGGGVGANDLALCAASLGPPLAPPGLSVLGAKLLLNPADPAFGPTAAVWNGTYAYAWPSGPIVFSGAPLHLPPALAGTDLHCQCMWVDLLTFAAAASNVATVHVY